MSLFITFVQNHIKCSSNHNKYVFVFLINKNMQKLMTNIFFISDFFQNHMK